MAGDFIMVEKATATKPEIFGIATALNISLDEAFAICIRFWIWCDDHLADGNAKNVTSALLDCYMGVTGFVDAMKSVGWLSEDDGILIIPNYDRWLSKNAKKRLDTNRRVTKHREQMKRIGNANVTEKALQKALPKKEIELEKENKEIHTHAREENSEVAQEFADNLTFLNSPTESFLRTFNLLPDWMRTGQSGAWKAYQGSILRTEVRHGMKSNEAETHIFQRTKLFVVSDKGKRREFHWTAKTYFEDDHFDDPVSSWEIVENKKPAKQAAVGEIPMPAALEWKPKR
jgi:hypothetical protein